MPRAKKSARKSRPTGKKAAKKAKDAECAAKDAERSPVVQKEKHDDKNEDNNTAEDEWADENEEFSISECDDEGAETDLEELRKELEGDPDYLSFLEDTWPMWSADMDGRLSPVLAFRQWVFQDGQCELTGLPMIVSARSSFYAPAIVPRSQMMALSHRMASGDDSELSMYNFCFVIQAVASMSRAAADHGCMSLPAFVRLAGLIRNE